MTKHYIVKQLNIQYNKSKGEKLMIRKIVTPILFITFNIMIFFIESSISLPLDPSGYSHNRVNLFNRILILSVLVLILFFEVRPQFRKMNTTKYKYIYLITTTVILFITSYYFIQNFVWK